MELQENNGFGKLPKPRGSLLTMITSVIAIALYIIVVVSYRSNAKVTKLLVAEDAGVVCAAISAILLGDFLRSLILLGEESNHLSSRYSNKWLKVLIACLPVNMEKMSCLLKMFIFIISTTATGVYWKFTEDIRFDWCAYTVVAFIMSLNHTTLTKAEISQLNETENKHVADGLAWSFYFGYLKLMLPCLGTMISKAVKADGYKIGDNDLREKLSAHKVFIVIPKDCYTYNTFTEVDDRITFACSMPPQKRTRGGVQERVYKNTVWKIQHDPDEEPSYVLMEYATPCLSMYDMMKHDKAKFTQEDLECQVKEFSIKLKSILDADPECRGKYELVLCGNVNKPKLGDIIYNTIHQGELEVSQ